MTLEIPTYNTRFLARCRLPVKIVKVDSPTLFWVQLQNNQEDFKEMLENLRRRMMRRSQNLRLRHDTLNLDEIVAVQEGRKWQRGIVTQIRGDATVVITLRDWGRTIERPCFETFTLANQFRELEWQAIPCALAYTAPDPSRNMWPRRTNELTRFLIDRRDGWISITGNLRGEAALVRLEIKNECGTEIKSLKNILIDLGHAKHSERVLEAARPSVQ